MLVFLFIFAHLPPARAQSTASDTYLKVSPHCGERGDLANVSGETALGLETCENHYYFDGAPLCRPGENAPDCHKDHTTAPPNRNFLVPSTAAFGRKKIRVELLDYEPKIRDCRVVDFDVVEKKEDKPWRPNNGIDLGSTEHGDLLTLTFNPIGVCEIEDCSKIRFVQSMRAEADLVTDSEIGPIVYTQRLLWTNLYGSPFKDPNFETAEGTIIDSDDATSPYYDENGGAGQYGVQAPADENPPPRPAILTDGPGRFPQGIWEWTVNASGELESNYQPRTDILRIRVFFEDAVRCAEGPDAGTWLGSATWVMEEDFYAEPFLSVDGKVWAMARIKQPRTAYPSGPSGDLIQALSKGGFPEPESVPPRTRAKPCGS